MRYSVIRFLTMQYLCFVCDLMSSLFDISGKGFNSSKVILKELCIVLNGFCSFQKLKDNS